jgi:MFS family permease
MLEVLTNRIYAKLFLAQVVALLGTGLLTIALGLLAYSFAGDSAGVVLGIALTVKMVAYVGLAPIASAVTVNLDRKKVLIAADLLRAAVALALPFTHSVWQIYILIFLLQASSATFTPTFQAAIPDILPDEKHYTQALSLSRLAYDIENILSPLLAGLLLTLISFHWLFLGTTTGFLISVLLVFSTTIPTLAKKDIVRSFRDRLTRGSRIYLATPRLRGLLSLNLTVAATGAVVLVNTVVLVRETYGGSESHVALAFTFFGAGSMAVALILPKVLERVRDWPVMISGALIVTGTMITSGMFFTFGPHLSWPWFLLLWFVIGAASSAIMTPSGRLLRRSAHSEDRPALFAAQFTFSHACWLIAYPSAGYLGKLMGMGPAMICLGCLAVLGCLAAFWFWPVSPQRIIEHSHDDLPEDHPHLQDAVVKNGKAFHRHTYIIDDEHRVWPTQG